MIDVTRRTRRLRRQLRGLVLISVTAFATGTAHGQTSAGPKQVSFQSASYVDPRQLLSREAPAARVTVSAGLSFPDDIRDRYPAVVVVHTIAGYNEANEGQYAAELRKAGFATLTYDSFAARGATGLALSRSGPGLWPSGVADAYAALRLLASDPSIDADRIIRPACLAQSPNPGPIPDRRSCCCSAERTTICRWRKSRAIWLTQKPRSLRSRSKP